MDKIPLRSVSGALVLRMMVTVFANVPANLGARNRPEKVRSIHCKAG